MFCGVRDSGAIFGSTDKQPTGIAVGRAHARSAFRGQTGSKRAGNNGRNLPSAFTHLYLLGWTETALTRHRRINRILSDGVLAGVEGSSQEVG